MTLDVGQPLTKLERARSEGILPTSSSLYSFTNPPNPTHNRSPCFSQARRMNHSASGSFLGTFFHQAEVNPKLQFPGAGSYDLDKSTIFRPATSCTRPSMFSRRSKISCASMGAARMTASLCGADQLLLEPGPEFGPAPRSDFDNAIDKRGYCSAAFASESKRFLAPHQIHGGKDLPKRKFARKLPHARKIPLHLRQPRLRSAPFTVQASQGRPVLNRETITAGGSRSPISTGNFHFAEGARDERKIDVLDLKDQNGLKYFSAVPVEFVGPDPHTYRDELRTAPTGRSRRLVAERIHADLTDVSRLEEFKPPNTKALRFY